MNRLLLVACVIALAGCHSDNLLSPDVVTFSAQSIVNMNSSIYRVPTPVIETTVTMTNTSDQVYSIKAGECGTFGLKVFRSSDFSGTPIWSLGPVTCALIGILPSPLNPGESRQFTYYATVAGVLGDSNPGGTYYVQVTMNYFSKDIEGRGGTVRINGGAVQLAR